MKTTFTNADAFRLFFRNREPGAVAWTTAFATPPKDASRGEWAGWALKPGAPLATDPGLDTYMCVSSFRKVDGRYRRRKANFAAMHAVMIDDIGTKVAGLDIALAATLRIETSPGNCQDWLKLDPPITDRQLAEVLIDRIIAAGLTADGTEPGMRGVTRCGRLPRGMKTKPRASGPWTHVVHEVRPDITYTSEEIAEAYGLDLTLPEPRTARPPVNPDAPPAVLGWLGELGLYQHPIGDGWHAIVCPWIHEHSDRAAAGTQYRSRRPAMR